MGRQVFGGAPFQPPDGTTITFTGTNKIQATGTAATNNPVVVNQAQGSNFFTLNDTSSSSTINVVDSNIAGGSIDWQMLSGAEFVMSSTTVNHEFWFTVDNGSSVGEGAQFVMNGNPATSGYTTVNSPTMFLNGYYWNGSASTAIQTKFYVVVDSATPTWHYSFTGASELAKLDQDGDLTITGWAYIKGKNRSYQQDLTASTTTSTSATLLGTSIGFTPKFSGYLVISAVVKKLLPCA